jgi:cyclophilin family peptidyl-prolyl cis-trans isomerase
MKFSIALVVIGACTYSSAFTPNGFSQPNSQTSTTLAKKGYNEEERMKPMGPGDLLGKACAMAMMTTLLWGAPSLVAQQVYQQIESTSPPPMIQMVMANAKEKASGSGSRVNKDAESLLRYGLPIKNKEVRSLQETIETIRLDIASKRKAAAIDGVKKSKSLLSGKSASSMIASCREAKVCSGIIEELSQTMDPLANALKDSQDAFTGSDQERSALDEAYKKQITLAKLLTTLEEQMVPANYETPVPDIYSDLPQLKKRATVEMVLKKPNAGEQFDVNGVNFPVAKLVMVIDGYTAPVTGGNFIDLVQKGFYDNMEIQRSDGFVVQTGDPPGKAIGYVGTPSKSIGAGPNGERQIPTEIFVKGDDGPFYESTIEDEGRGGEATVLPFSAYGAMGWARDEYDVNSGSSQFFWLLFDSDLTPAGKNVLDGRYPCFGYVVEGSDFLSAIKEGDVIASAKVTDGLQYLVQPKTD